MTTANAPSSSGPRKVDPDELTKGFEGLGLGEGDAVVLHASLESMGTVDGGAAMVLHRLLRLLGKQGTLLMPTFTSITTHSNTHDDYTQPGCWCGGKEDRHVPFIPELQPDKNIGAIAQRLCSWPSSRRSGHPAYSFVAVGKHGDELVRDYSLDDPLLPIKRFQKLDPQVVTIGLEFNSVTTIHIAQQLKMSQKSAKERSLIFTSKGRSWVEITALGCSNGFKKLKPHLEIKNSRTTEIGLATADIYSMRELIEHAISLLEKQPTALLCDNVSCLSCSRGRS